VARQRPTAARRGPIPKTAKPAKASSGGGGPRRRGTARAPDSRARLVAAAADVLRESGYRAASIDAVLARSGVAKSNLYYHFPSKLELACAGVDHWLEDPDLPVLMGTLADERLRGLDRVRRWIELFAELSGKDGGPCGCRFGMLAAEEDLPEPLRIRVEGALRSLRQAVAAALQAGVRDGSARPEIDCDRVAASILAAAQGGGLAGRLARDSDRIVSCCDGMLDLIAAAGPAGSPGATATATASPSAPEPARA